MSISAPGLSPEEVSDIKFSRLLALDFIARSQGWTQLTGMPFWNSWLQDGETLYTMVEDSLYCFPLGMLWNANWNQIWILSGRTDEYPNMLMGIYDSVEGEDRPGIRLHASGLTHIETDEGSFNLHKFTIDPIEGLELINAWLVLGFHNQETANFILYTHSVITIPQEQQIFRNPLSFYYPNTGAWSEGEVPESLVEGFGARTPINLVPGIVLQQR